MANSKKKKDEQDFGQIFMDLGLGLGGGIIANQVSNIAQKQEFMADYQQFVPAVPALLGVAAYVFLPKEWKPLAFGMFVVGGTEGAETLIAKATGAMAGNPNSVLENLGFSPQYIPEENRGAMVKTSSGVAVR